MSLCQYINHLVLLVQTLFCMHFSLATESLLEPLPGGSQVASSR